MQKINKKKELHLYYLSTLTHLYYFSLHHSSLHCLQRTLKKISNNIEKVNRIDSAILIIDLSDLESVIPISDDCDDYTDCIQLERDEKKSKYLPPIRQPSVIC